MGRLEEAQARADANRLALEKERARALAKGAKLAAEQASRAHQERLQAEARREQQAQEQLRQLKQRWEAADKHVVRRNDGRSRASPKPFSPALTVPLESRASRAVLLLFLDEMLRRIQCERSRTGRQATV